MLLFRSRPGMHRLPRRRAAMRPRGMGNRMAMTAAGGMRRRPAVRLVPVQADGVPAGRRPARSVPRIPAAVPRRAHIAMRHSPADPLGCRGGAASFLLGGRGWSRRRFGRRRRRALTLFGVGRPGRRAALHLPVLVGEVGRRAGRRREILGSRSHVGRQSNSPPQQQRRQQQKQAKMALDCPQQTHPSPQRLAASIPHLARRRRAGAIDRGGPNA
jgi:hypothetical protein